MLTKVEVRNAAGALLTLMLEDISNGYAIESIEGLDPVKATIVSSSFASLDGTQYQSSRRESRNILLKVALEPNFITQTVRGLRNGLYSFFMPKTEVDLRFYDSDGLIVDITGRVESLESALFSAEPTVDISIICFDPDLVELSSITYNGNTVSTTAEFAIDYAGTSETGFSFVLHLNRSLTQFTIYHRPPDGSLRTLDFAASLVNADVLTISTLVGSKGVSLLRGGVTSSLLYGMTPQSSWIELLPGLNHLRVYATGAAIPFDITYMNRHGGL